MVATGENYLGLRGIIYDLTRWLCAYDTLTKLDKRTSAMTTSLDFRDHITWHEVVRTPGNVVRRMGIQGHGECRMNKDDRVCAVLEEGIHHRSGSSYMFNSRMREWGFKHGSRKAHTNGQTQALLFLEN